MTSSTAREAPRTDRLDALVLARVGSGPLPATPTLARALRAFAPATTSDAAWTDRVGEAVARLRAAGAIDDGGVRDASALTRAGLRAGPWRQVIERQVPVLALGITPEARVLKALSDRDRWAAAIVARARGLWQGGAPPSPSKVCDAVVWEGLGLSGTPKRTPPEIRAHFLGKLIDTAPAPPDRLLRLLAARAVDAPRADLASLRQALARRWLWEPGEQPRGFVEVVRDAARGATEGTFGPRKVFIASVWRALRDHPEVRGVDLAGFKQRLVEAHRAGQLTLARADLTAAMDPELVAASETAHLDARYHFIEREGTP